MKESPEVATAVREADRRAKEIRKSGRWTASPGSGAVLTVYLMSTPRFDEAEALGFIERICGYRVEPKTGEIDASDWPAAMPTIRLENHRPQE